MPYKNIEKKREHNKKYQQEHKEELKIKRREYLKNIRKKKISWKKVVEN